MSPFVKWTLFVSTLFAAAVAIFMVWQGVDENVVKLVVSFAVLVAASALTHSLGRAKPPASGEQAE